MQKIMETSLPLALCRSHQCGEFILTYEAKSPLHIAAVSFLALPPIQPLPQLQKIIHAECRTSGRNSSESVDWKQIRDIEQKGLQSPGVVVVKNTILSPAKVPANYFILISHQRMERMGDAEPTRGSTVMTCSC